MISCRVLALMTIVGTSTLTGCSDPAPEGGTAEPSVAKPAVGPKAATLSSEMVAAVPTNRNNTAISVHFVLDAPPAVATPLPVRISIVPHQKFESLRAHFEGQESLAMPVGENFGPVGDVAVEKSLSHQLVLLPAKEGMFMVTVGVETTGEDGNIVRSFSIPVIVGPAQPASPAPATPAKD